MVSDSGGLVARLWVGKSGGGKRADFDSLFQRLGKERWSGSATVAATMSSHRRCACERLTL
jgi:hypothetical protein